MTVITEHASEGVLCCDNRTGQPSVTRARSALTTSDTERHDMATANLSTSRRRKSVSLNTYHPNRVEFSGTLATVDKPSDRRPHGARGHRILLRRSLVRKYLPSLRGMAVSYSKRGDRHDPRRKVGVITKARLDGPQIAFVISGVPVR